MTFSHSSCSHPATSRDRALCRKAANGEITNRGAATGSSPTIASKATRAKRARKGKEDAEDIIQAVYAEKAERNAKANQRRTEATQARFPLKDRSECYVCGSRAAHFVKKTAQPVCMKHIDNWDGIGIIPA